MDDSTTAFRVFSAIEIDSSTQIRHVLSTLREMGGPVRPVREDQLHITLKFFGNVSREQIAEITRCQDAACANHSSFDWQLQGLGAFPTLERMRVIWAGTGDEEPLQNLERSISKECEKAGFSPDPRPFHPHLTLARVKYRPPASVAELIRKNSSVNYGLQRASEVVLFQSMLLASGPVYRRLHTSPLNHP